MPRQSFGCSWTVDRFRFKWQAGRAHDQDGSELCRKLQAHGLVFVLCRQLPKSGVSALPARPLSRRSLRESLLRCLTLSNRTSCLSDVIQCSAARAIARMLESMLASAVKLHLSSVMCPNCLQQSHLHCATVLQGCRRHTTAAPAPPPAPRPTGKPMRRQRRRATSCSRTPMTSRCVSGTQLCRCASRCTAAVKKHQHGPALQRGHATCVRRCACGVVRKTTCWS